MATTATTQASKTDIHLVISQDGSLDYPALRQELDFVLNASTQHMLYETLGPAWLIAFKGHNIHAVGVNTHAPLPMNFQNALVDTIIAKHQLPHSRQTHLEQYLHQHQSPSTQSSQLFGKTKANTLTSNLIAKAIAKLSRAIKATQTQTQVFSGDEPQINSPSSYRP